MKLYWPEHIMSCLHDAHTIQALYERRMESSLCHAESRLPTRMCQRHGSTSLRQGEVVMIFSEPKAVCLSLLGLLAASSPQSGFTEPFPFAAFLAGDWLQKAKGQRPSEPAPGFTLPWVDRSCAQCRTPETAGAKFYNTPPSGRCTPEYGLKGYQFHL